MKVDETPADHYASAERNLDLADDLIELADPPWNSIALARAHYAVACAKVHAILATVPEDAILGRRE